MLAEKKAYLAEVTLAFVDSGNATTAFGPISDVADLSARLETLIQFKMIFGYFKSPDEPETLQNGFELSDFCPAS